LSPRRAERYHSGVSTAFQELAHHPTPLGDLVLRRRTLPGRPLEWVFEVTLGGAFLMSSLVTDSEVALARLALAARGPGRWSVLVGGLGLGYTANEALASPHVQAVTVVELLPEVIAWHERGLLPLGRALADEPRCRLVADDFFAVVAAPPAAEARFDVVLVDIDHGPEALLQRAHARFYTLPGLEALRRHLAPGGVFGLWAGLAPDPEFLDRLGQVFPSAWAEIVRFENPSVSRQDTNTIYLARA
jgi:spermidine synthase